MKNWWIPGDSDLGVYCCTGKQDFSAARDRECFRETAGDLVLGL